MNVARYPSYCFKRDRRARINKYRSLKLISPVATSDPLAAATGLALPYVFAGVRARVLYVGYRRIPVMDAIPEAESEFETNWNFGEPGNWLRRIF